LDLFERTGLSKSINYYNWCAFQFWRFVLVQDVVGKFAASFAEFPPMQKSASFNLDAIKEQVHKAGTYAAA
jgi:hypothetical protein